MDSSKARDVTLVSSPRPELRNVRVITNKKRRSLHKADPLSLPTLSSAMGHIRPTLREALREMERRKSAYHAEEAPREDLAKKPSKCGRKLTDDPLSTSDSDSDAKKLRPSWPFNSTDAQGRWSDTALSLTSQIPFYNSRFEVVRERTKAAVFGGREPTMPRERAERETAIRVRSTSPPRERSQAVGSFYFKSTVPLPALSETPKPPGPEGFVYDVESRRSPQSFLDMSKQLGRPGIERTDSSPAFTGTRDHRRLSVVSPTSDSHHKRRNSIGGDLAEGQKRLRLRRTSSMGFVDFERQIDRERARHTALQQGERTENRSGDRRILDSASAFSAILEREIAGHPIERTLLSFEGMSTIPREPFQSRQPASHDRIRRDDSAVDMATKDHITVSSFEKQLPHRNLILSHMRVDLEYDPVLKFSSQMRRSSSVSFDGHAGRSQEMPMRMTSHLTYNPKFDAVSKRVQGPSFSPSKFASEVDHTTNGTSGTHEEEG